MNAKKLAIVSLALAGVFAAATVEARGRDDVQLSVTIGGPAYGLQPVPVYRPGFVAPSYGHGYGHRDRSYREPTRWDRDGDGVPNRYDRRDNRGSRW